MALARPFHRRSPHPTPPTRTSRSSAEPLATTGPDAPPHTPTGIPRELVLDATGKPRRSVLLAAIMIRRGRSMAEIATATGLPAEVVQTLGRTG